MVVKGKVQSSISRQPPYKSAEEAIRGRRIWLSGGIGGLGLEFARAFIRFGCAGIALADVAEEAVGKAALKELQNGLTKEQDIRYFRVDVRDVWRVRESMMQAAIAFGGLDTVINNAGVADEREIDWTVAVNLVAVMTATEAALEVLEKSGSGGMEKVIVNVASAGGVFAMPVAPVYAASKHGVLGYTKSMRNACWERGVRINCFCPGWVSVGLGKAVSQIGQTAKFTGILEKETVADVLVEIFRRRDLVGEAVYVSKTSGPRIVHPDISTKLKEARFAKM